MGYGMYWALCTGVTVKTEENYLFRSSGVLGLIPHTMALPGPGSNVIEDQLPLLMYSLGNVLHRHNTSLPVSSAGMMIVNVLVSAAAVPTESLHLIRTEVRKYCPSPSLAKVIVSRVARLPKDAAIEINVIQGGSGSVIVEDFFEDSECGSSLEELVKCPRRSSPCQVFVVENLDKRTPQSPLISVVPVRELCPLEEADDPNSSMLWMRVVWG